MPNCHKPVAPRLIDADALYKELDSRSDGLHATNGDYDHYTTGWDDCMERVENAPTIDAVPVVHGRWVEIQTEPERLCKCSECGYPGRNFWDKTKYCPSCGAKMNKEEADHV